MKFKPIKMHTIQIYIDDDTHKIYTSLKKKWKLSNTGVLYDWIDKRMD